VSSLNESGVQHLAQEIDALRRENEALLRELENAYAQLTAVLQVSQDETRIAYSELQEKLVVQEKKLVELAFLSSAGEALLGESELERLRRLVVDKVCLLLPADLVLLHLVSSPDSAVQRERDVVREVVLDRAAAEALTELGRTIDSEGRGILLVPDLETATADRGLRMRPDARSAAGLALRDGPDWLGLLVLNSRLRSNFRDDQEPLLTTFAHQASAALAAALRLQRHRDLVVRIAATAGLNPAALERSARQTLPAAAHAELRHVLDRVLAPVTVTAGSPRTDKETR
jgi:GAF domain-containing protein